MPFIQRFFNLSCLAKLKNLYHSNPGEFYHKLLYFFFWISIAFFPAGYGFREVMPPVCFVFLLLYYRYEWKNSVLKNLAPVWLFFCLLLMILIGIIFSIHPWQSLLHAGTGINKAFILPFIAMECTKSKNELVNIAWAFAFACFWQGIDGIWQAATGKDIIFGYTLNGGRLTGSLGDYTVGNYIALAMVPAYAVWFVLREKLGILCTFFICTAIFWPALFLLQGASSRSSVLALAGIAFLWPILITNKISIKYLIYPSLISPFIIFAAFTFFQDDRFTVDAVSGDARWDLWQICLKVFLKYPFFGAGAGQYNNAFREMGLEPAKEAITISHPHNLYLDILYAHGITGFCLGMVFICGFLVWGFKNIVPELRKEKYPSNYWHITAWFFLAYIAWLINGIFGHDFYRIWWLAMAMTSLGIMCGAIVNGKKYYQRK